MHKIELLFFITPANNKSADNNLHFMLHLFTCDMLTKREREKRAKMLSRERMFLSERAFTQTF